MSNSGTDKKQNNRLITQSGSKMEESKEAKQVNVARNTLHGYQRPWH